MRDHPTPAALDAFIARWRANEGGAERANYVLFLTELCALLDLPQPDPADATHDRNDYVFERAVDAVDAAGQVSHRRIDLYRRGCFVLEAKQSREPGGAKEVMLAPVQSTLSGLPSAPARGRRGASHGWDVLMRNAFEQAKQYAQALPTAHGWPPFIIVSDVGHALELFADFSGQGKNYRQYPDRAGYRIHLDDLTDPAVRDRLRRVWLDPLSLDPDRHSARVTRDIAGRLASVSKLLEAREHEPAVVAIFLMRCLFTMFSEEDKVGLLPPGSFTGFLRDARDAADSFAPLLEELWKRMDEGGVSALLRKPVRRFNGGLFKGARAIALNREEIGELYEAARHDWTDVDPAIFGTLLEQALDKDERRRLGAHYTPRAYVERLVTATVIEPLRVEWELVVLGAVERERASDPSAAIDAVRAFHLKLAQTRVLDPACGTGNFLYVALELMKRLEGEVLQVLAELGGQEALALETETVHPKNFLGLELNARAAVIAELVLWLGYLQWQLRNGREITDPVLEERHTIEARDAVLLHDGERVKPGGGLELVNPRRPPWPEADYIVGNPPFIGKGAALRSALGDPYCEALWRAHPHINKSADFVMYWWDRAAELLTRPQSRLKRFGLVTTNSISQVLSRKVIAKRLEARPPVHIVRAYPDHPWTKATADAAAVRIAMTVVAAGPGAGALHVITGERALDTDEPQLQFRVGAGVLNADLTTGADVGAAQPLRANLGLSCNGMMLAARGFLLTAADAAHIAADPLCDETTILKRYMGGVELARSGDPKLVIDTFGLDPETLRTRFPRAYQHLLTTVRPERLHRRDNRFRERWWEFGRPRQELRTALAGLARYIGTTETTRYRTFQFIPADTLPDHMVIAFALDDYVHFGVLSSRVHLLWVEQAGGWLGIGNDSRYSKSRVFDTFPFPVATDAAARGIEAVARELDLAREAIRQEHPDIGMSTLYRLLDAVRADRPLDLADIDLRRRGRIDLLRELHGRLKDAVLAAYGWADSPTDAAIIDRLTALNAERRAGEKRGHVHWLRPDYQRSRAGVTAIDGDAADVQLEAALPDAARRKPAFPRDAIGQTAAVFHALRTGDALDARAIAARFAQGRRAEPRIAATLAALERLGHVARDAGGYRLRRAA